MDIKEKFCFIIMPISDVDGYPAGHFKRVYDFLIKPACKLAGFTAMRADDVLNTNYIALDIVKQIINADMALCDLSARNPNVLYELGIRQAFNKPVTLIKDTATHRIFDIAGFRDVEYEESLRVDTIQSNVPLIADTIKNTYESKGTEINSLVSLLSIEPAKVEKSIPITIDTELLLNSINSIDLRIKDLESKITRTKTVFKPSTELANYLKSKFDLEIGDRIEHSKFGPGIIVSIEGSIHNPVLTVDFDEHERKKMMLNYMKYNKIEDLPF